MDQQKFKKRNDFKGRPRDNRQKGFVSAFVQGKGQNAALKYLMDTKTQVCIFLITGVKFEGIISAFDPFTISITDIKDHQQMIYKDKISTLTLRKVSQEPRPFDSHKAPAFQGARDRKDSARNTAEGGQSF